MLTKTDCCKLKLPAANYGCLLLIMTAFCYLRLLVANYGCLLLIMALSFYDCLFYLLPKPKIYPENNNVSTVDRQICVMQKLPSDMSLSTQK
jgi:hypothetical protein